MLTASTFKIQTKITARCKECVVDCDQPFSFGWTEPGQLRVEESGEPRKSKIRTSNFHEYAIQPHPACCGAIPRLRNFQARHARWDVQCCAYLADHTSLSIKEAVRELDISPKC